MLFLNILYTLPFSQNSVKMYEERNVSLKILNNLNKYGIFLFFSLVSREMYTSEEFWHTKCLECNMHAQVGSFACDDRLWATLELTFLGSAHTSVSDDQQVALHKILHDISFLISRREKAISSDNITDVH